LAVDNRRVALSRVKRARRAETDLHVRAYVRTTYEAVRDAIAVILGRQLRKVEQMMLAARDDLLGLHQLPAAALTQIWSTIPLERLNREVKRRTDVVGVFPSPAALLHRAGAVQVEGHDDACLTGRVLESSRMGRCPEMARHDDARPCWPRLSH